MPAGQGGIGSPRSPRNALTPRAYWAAHADEANVRTCSRQISRWGHVSRIDVQAGPRRRCPSWAGGASPSAGFSRRFQPPKIYGRIGSLEVRLARKKSEIRRAQRLRYKVFYEEMSAMPDALAILSRRDEDAYDPIFDHLLVIDHGNSNGGRRWRRSKVVGTYRVLRQEVADLYDGFYTQGEYDIAPLLRAKSPDYSFMELGRSCVLKPYRNKRTLELLWQGVWSYVREHGADVMIGCASFPGTDPSAHALALSYPASYRAGAGGMAGPGA